LVEGRTRSCNANHYKDGSQAELLRLRKENEQLRIEREILLCVLGVKKAAAFFAKEVE
jgi:hypothetical protein